MGLCWIDDDTGSIMEIANSVFCELWMRLDSLEMDIKIFGDDYMHNASEGGMQESDLDAVREKLRNKFREICFSIDKKRWKKPGETYIQKAPNMPVTCKGISCHNAEIKHLIEPWRKIDSTQPAGIDYDYKSFTQYDSLCDELIARFEIKETDTVALDICLLQSDIERCKNKLPLLSMSIYHQLQQKNHRCFLYSRMSVNSGKRQNWRDVYREIYNIEGPKIHSRIELCSSSDSEDFKDFLEMIT